MGHSGIITLPLAIGAIVPVLVVGTETLSLMDHPLEVSLANGALKNVFSRLGNVGRIVFD